MPDLARYARSAPAEIPSRVKNPSRVKSKQDKRDKFAQSTKHVPTDTAPTTKKPFVGFVDYPEENVNPDDPTEEWEIDTSWMAIRQKCLFKWWLQQAGVDSTRQWHIKAIWRNDDMINFENPHAKDTSDSLSKEVYPQSPKDIYWQKLVEGILEAANVDNATLERFRETMKKELNGKSTSSEKRSSPENTGTQAEGTPSQDKRPIEDPDSGDTPARKLLKLRAGPFSQDPSSQIKTTSRVRVQSTPSKSMRAPRYIFRDYKFPKRVRRDSTTDVSSLELSPTSQPQASNSHDAADELSAEDEDDTSIGVKALRKDFKRLRREPRASHSHDVADELSAEDEDDTYIGVKALRKDFKRLRRESQVSNSHDAADESSAEDEDNTYIGVKALRKDFKRLRRRNAINITPTRTDTTTPTKVSTPKSVPAKMNTQSWKTFSTPVKSPPQTQKSGRKHHLTENTPVGRTVRRFTEPGSPHMGHPVDVRKKLDETQKAADYEYVEQDSRDGYFYDPLRRPHPKNPDPNIIYRHIKVPPERRIPQTTCYYRARPFSMDCQWDNGEGLGHQNWKPKTIPFGELDQRTRQEGPQANAPEPQSNQGSEPPETYYMSEDSDDCANAEGSPAPSAIFPRRFPRPGNGFRIWYLECGRLQDMACAGILSATRYTYWKGIVESVNFFLDYEHIIHPLERPELDSPKANRSPMMEINVLAKALWEFDKSLRIFMRAAILYRREYPEQGSEFWVESPLFHAPTARFLADFIGHRTELPVHFLDGDDNFPVEGNPDALKFRINLLSTYGFAPAYHEAVDNISSIWTWMFGPGDDGQQQPPLHEWVQSFRVNKSLSNPPYTSYLWRVAWPYFHNIREWDRSPQIQPSSRRPDDLGDLQYHPLEEHELHAIG